MPADYLRAVLAELRGAAVVHSTQLPAAVHVLDLQAALQLGQGHQVRLASLSVCSKAVAAACCHAHDVSQAALQLSQVRRVLDCTHLSNSASLPPVASMHAVCTAASSKACTAGPAGCPAAQATPPCTFCTSGIALVRLAGFWGLSTCHYCSACSCCACTKHASCLKYATSRLHVFGQTCT